MRNGCPARYAGRDGLIFCTLGIFILLLLPSAAGAVSFSPDGSKVVFAWQPTPKQTELFTARVDGSDFQLTPGTDDALSPAWSPDGRYILFATRSAAAPGSATSPSSATSPESTTSPGLELYDSESRQVRTLQPGVLPPLIWRQDHLRLGGILQKQGHPDLYLYDLQGGGTMMDVSLPVSSVVPHNASIVWAPDTDLVALIGDSNVYMEEQGIIHPISTTGDVIGLGLTSGGKGFLWARRERSGNNVMLTLYRYDLKARSAQKVSFPPKGAVVPSSLNGQAGPPEYVVFSPNGTRVAEVVTVTVPPLHPQDPPTLYRAVYVCWLNGSGGKLIAQTPAPPAPTQSSAPEQPLHARNRTRDRRSHTHGQPPELKPIPKPQIPDRLIPVWAPNNLDLAVQEIGATPSVKIYDSNGKVSRIAPHAG